MLLRSPTWRVEHKVSAHYRPSQIVSILNAEIADLSPSLGNAFIFVDFGVIRAQFVRSILVVNAYADWSHSPSLVLSSLETSISEILKQLSWAAPPEILSQIFRECVSELPRYQLWENRTIKTLVHLSSVCGQWRDVALATGDLWSLIHLDDHYLPPVELLETWISRAGSHPLTYIVKWRKITEENLDPGGDKRDILFEVLLRHVGLAREVDFVLPDGHITRLVDLVDPLPTLQRLSLRQVLPYHETSSIHTFRNAPALIRARLQDILPTHCPLPWQQLQFCELVEPDIEDCIDILQQCNSIVDFSIKNPMLPTDGAQYFPKEQTLCPTLKKLHIADESEKDVFTPLLDSITAPNLVALDLRCFAFGADPADFKHLSSSIVSFLVRSSCDLRGLALGCLPFTSDEPMCYSVYPI